MISSPSESQNILVSPIFWGVGGAPGFLLWDYKIQPDSDNVAKFQSDWSRDVGERVAKKGKQDNITGKR